MQKMQRLLRNKKIVFPIIGLTIAVVITTGYMVLKDNTKELSTVQETVIQEQKTKDIEATETLETTPAVVEESKPTPSVAEEAPIWPVQLTTAEAGSITVVVNKKHKLPSDYVPELTEVTGGQLRPEAAQAMTSLLFKANEVGVPMKIISSYRSYSTQVSTYNKWVAQSGQAQADTFSARSGHSEHQTGLAVDLGMPDGTCNLEICFGSTAQGLWLDANAPNYGFVIRYDEDKEPITGYQYEPWHVRYVGVETAKAIVSSGQTLDEYYGIEAGGY
jgi:D-alanyl-D-alanine carboxypeptidase